MIEYHSFILRLGHWLDDLSSICLSFNLNRIAVLCSTPLSALDRYHRNIRNENCSYFKGFKYYLRYQAQIWNEITSLLYKLVWRKLMLSTAENERNPINCDQPPQTPWSWVLFLNLEERTNPGKAEMNKTINGNCMCLMWEDKWWIKCKSL